jgi:hypothetical protein
MTLERGSANPIVALAWRDFIQDRTRFAITVLGISLP